MTTIWPRDCLKAGLCLDGQRRFLSRHGFDFRAFVRNGIEIDRLEGITDGNLARAINAAEIREVGNGRRR